VAAIMTGASAASSRASMRNCSTDAKQLLRGIFEVGYVVVAATVLDCSLKVI
jgi:hypothetical protein